MVKMASKRTKNKKDIMTHPDQENIPPGEVYFPPYKKARKDPCLQLSHKVEPRYHQPRSVNSRIKRKRRMKGEIGWKQDQKGRLLEESLQKISLSAEKLDNHFPKTYKPRSPTYNREKSQPFLGGISDVEREAGGGATTAAEPRVGIDQTQKISELLDRNKSVECRSTGHCKLETPNRKIEKPLGRKQWESDCEEIGRSVCKISVDGVRQGTGFVLLDRLVITSAHLFRDCVKGKSLLHKVSVVFEQEPNGEPHPGSRGSHRDLVLDKAEDKEEPIQLLFTVKETFVDIDEMLDYAVLELIPKDQGANQPQVPPGLLRRFGPVQGSRDICVIGYPDGLEKTFKYTSIIEKENREKVKEEHLAQYKGLIITENSVRQLIENRGFKDITEDGFKADLVTTYCSAMYGGTSGSPVICKNDRRITVIAKHIGGFGYGFPKITNSVIEFAHSLLTIFKKFVSNLKDIENKQLLDRIRLEVQENVHLKTLIE